MPDALIYCFLFLVGTVFGSFIDVLVSRTVSGKSFLFGRSECDSCHKTLSALDLIPLVSFLLLGGKCRYCKKEIPKRLFFIEFSVGLLFLSAYLLTALPAIPFTLLLLLLTLLVAIFVADVRFGIIPDQFLLSFGVFTLLFLIFQVGSFQQIAIQIGIHILAGIIAFLFFFSIFFVTKGKGMGFGDVKFSFFIGFLLSFTLMIASFYIAFLTGALISLILIVGKKKRFKGSTIPFGPFMVLGTIVSLLFETQVLHVMHIFFGI